MSNWISWKHFDNIYDFCDFSLLNGHFCPIFEEVNFLAKNKDKFNFLTVDYLGKNLIFIRVNQKIFFRNFLHKFLPKSVKIYDFCNFLL